MDSPARVLIAIVRAYRFFASPWLGSACRFTPTCSAYSLEALQHHGAAAGSYLTLGRIVRCHPWCTGGVDPVPERLPHWMSKLTMTSTSRAARAPSTTQGQHHP
jgi:uncharacterized protein